MVAGDSIKLPESYHGLYHGAIEDHRHHVIPMSSRNAMNQVPRPLSARDVLALFQLGLLLTGAGFVAAGVFFSLIFAAGADFEASAFSDRDPTVSATITGVQSPGRKAKNGTYRFDYTYEVNGKRYANSSYTSEPDIDFTTASDRIEVQYLAARPERSRIVGMDSAPFSPWLALAGLPGLLVGVPLIALAVRRAMHDLRFVRHGIVTTARCSRRARTDSGKRSNVRHDVVLHFEAHDGKTHEIELGPVGHQQRESTRVIYLGADPARAMRYDDLPKQARALIARSAGKTVPLAG